jgi:hypothetical protein
MTKISPEQLATRCITIAECYAFFRAMFKNPHDHNLIASPDELISNSKFIIELSNSLSDRIILLWCSMYGVDRNNYKDTHLNKPENYFLGLLDIKGVLLIPYLSPDEGAN